MKLKKIATVVLALLMLFSTVLVACTKKPRDDSEYLTVDLTVNEGAELSRFTESWRSVKQQGWGIRKGVSEAVLNRSLALMDYLYSKDGNKLMSYGPDAFIANNGTGTITYNGKQVPKLSDATLADLATTADGNYTNYYRRYIGGTFPVGYVKEQGMEYQTVHDKGKVGLDYILNGVRTGTVDHLQVSAGEYEYSNTATPINTSANVTLKLAVMFDTNAKITFNQNNWTAPDGNTYIKDVSIKPVWTALATKLNFTIEDVASTESSAKDVKTLWEAFVNNQTAYDMIVADATNFVEFGVGTDGRFVNLNDHLDKMPNYKHFLDNNPSIRKMILAGDGAMYYAPYFDGYDDLERMFMMRVDWVQKLLDGTAPSFDTAATLATTAYTPFMPEKFNEKLTVTTSASATGTITKKYDKNIITIQNELDVKNGKNLTEALRNYIDSTYGTQYAKRSDLFCGQNAAYDADELIALLRCVETNPALLTGSADTDVIAFYPRNNTADRLMDLYRLMGIWGIRGLEARNNFYYVDADGQLKDVRLEAKTMAGLEKLNQLYKEKLVVQDFNLYDTIGGKRFKGDNTFRGQLNAQNRGFMTHDYNQTTTVVNKLGDTGGYAVDGGASGEKVYIEGFNLTPVMPPFTDWGTTSKTKADDPRFTTVPTANPLTADEKTTIATYTNLTGMFNITSGNGGTSNNGSGVSEVAWSYVIINGFGADKTSGTTTLKLTSKEAFYNQIKSDWYGDANLLVQNSAFQRFVSLG